MRCLPVRRAEGFNPRRIREVQSMLPEFVDRIGGSRWVSALPTGSKWLSALPTGAFPVNPRRQRRPSIRKEACGFADLGRFNLWRPMVVDRIGGSKWNRALPGGSKWVQAQPAGSRWNRALPGPTPPNAVPWFSS